MDRKSPHGRTLVRARLVVPIVSPPVENGAVLIEANRILKVGRWADLRNEANRTTDLGEAVVMPGLVNAHCHLDYTDMAGLLPPPRIFTDWLKAITETKAGWTLEDYRRSWLNGAEMLLTTGTTTVGDIEAVPELLPSCWESSPLRVFSFLEMISIGRLRQPGHVLDSAMKKVSSLKHHRCRAGLSPHAPYTTVPALLKRARSRARKRRLPLCIHVAESRLEYDMFSAATGEMYWWIQKSGRDMSDCGKRTPVQHLLANDFLGEDVIATHANYLGRGDAELLGQKGVSVVHCPRSHHYFNHARFPLNRLVKAGVNVSIGTDSLASVYKGRKHRVSLSMLEELRMLATNEPRISERALVRMATINGAAGLGMAKQLGELSSGAYADLIALPIKTAARRAYQAVLGFEGKVCASMIDGQWAIEPAD